MKALGLRNNNPLNIRYVPGTRWQGSLPQEGRLESLEEQVNAAPAPQRGASSHLRRRKEGVSFVRFSSMEFGLRAAYKILDTYRRKYHANCIRDIITRWAPPSENDTEQYIRNVCKWTGYGGNERLTEAQWPALVRAMARQECGVELSNALINKAFEMFKGKT